MFSFVHKKHMYKDRPEAKFVIYYSVSDIILGLLLVLLVGFFASNYLQEYLSPKAASCQAPAYGSFNLMPNGR